MTPEPNADADPRATTEWLDGLAGRGGDSAAAREAARLREALRPAEAELAAAPPPPAWDEIVARADRARSPVPVPSANQSRWKRLATGGAAAVVLSIGVWIWNLPTTGTDDGLRGSPSSAGAQWRVADPATAARDLAARLEAVGARVGVTPMDDGARLDISCGTASAQRVNQELAALDTAVDAACRLSLRVSAPR